MRILFLSPRECRPPNSGARLRDLHLSRSLAKNADVTYLGFTTGAGTSFDGMDSVLVLREEGYTASHYLRGLLGPTPATFFNYRNAAMDAALRQTLADGNFDLVQMEGVHLSAYAQTILDAPSRPRLYCDWHNIESELMERRGRESGPLKRLYCWRTSRLILAREDRLLMQCHGHSVCSEREREALLKRVPVADIRVVPNGVDCDAFKPSERPLSERKSLVFVGSMDYDANIDAAQWFAHEAWPQIHKMRPDLRFVIVGSRPTAEVCALARQPGITVTGTVDSIQPYYDAAFAAVVPLRVGGGTRLKVLEAMASGVPVISTPLGCEGIAYTEGWHLLVEREIKGFRSAVHFLGDEPLWRALSSEGRKLALKYDWAEIGEELWQHYAALEPATRRG